ncbi:MAG: ABC transporter permease subunit [Bacillota bacterium]|nr:ABC transporter permease subunit [Bacillota bacterium]
MFHYIPMAGTIIAFKDYNPIKGLIDSPWAGLKYFKQAFTDYYFWRVLRNTIILSLMRIFLAFPVPIILALLLNEIRNLTFKRSVQTVVYLPHFVSWVIMGAIILNFLSLKGVINNVIELLGGERIYFMSKPDYFRPIVVVTAIIKEAGWGTILYIAAITGINPEIYDSALVDGANRFQRMIYVTLPGISNTIVMLFILQFGGLLAESFDQIYMLSNSLVMETADVIPTYVYRTGILNGRYSYTTTVGLFQSLVGLGLIIGADRLFKKMNTEGLF